MPPRQRSRNKKCLMCPAMTNPRDLSDRNAYEKDFLCMSMDPREDLACPHECGFTASQNGLDEHLRSLCPRRTVSCALCHATHRAEEDHARVCPYMKACPECEIFVSKTEMDHHLMAVHEYVECEHCPSLFSRAIAEKHVPVCPFRKMPCPECAQRVVVDTMRSHLMKHLARLEVRVAEAAEVLRKARLDSDRVMRAILKLP